MADSPGPGWELPGFPHQPQEELELVEVRDAYLTQVRRGPLRSAEPPHKWLRGAVHDAEGRLLPVSQKIGGLGGNQGVQADPGRVPTSSGAERLRGTWLYGGHWIGHFGHFFTETVTTLWPDDLEVEGVVFHAYFGAFKGVQPWQEQLMSLTGYGDLPVRVVEREPVWVDRLHVPGRSVVVNGWAYPAAARVWARMLAAAGGGDPAAPERVYLSRTAFNAEQRAGGRPERARTSPERDLELDRVFAEAGFEVVAPERLAVLDQLRLAGGATVLAGCAGTALHLSAFAPAGTRVLEVGDARSPEVQVPQQRVIDQVCRHPSRFVPHRTTGADLGRLLERLV